MSWTLFKVNVLKSMVSGQFSKDPDSFAEFYANEYDQCIKRGGDMIYGVPIINGNVKGMADVIKRALKKEWKVMVIILIYWPKYIRQLLMNIG